MKKIIFAFIAVAAILFVGCTTPTSCNNDFEDSGRATQEVAKNNVYNTTLNTPDQEETQTLMGIEHRGEKYFVYAEKKLGTDSYIFAVVTDAENVNEAVTMQNRVATVIYRMTFEEFKAGCLALSEKGYAADNGYLYYHREYKSRLFATAHAVMYPELCLGY